jgi:hypothetical protein
MGAIGPTELAIIIIGGLKIRHLVRTGFDRPDSVEPT